ncbi:MAG: hypothetical protein LC687_04980 [Actinobacteria bacterium]|nr:hypothetical protein [Actinomycetota bacterium]MCA1807188.1 hypothetical protein [Actinomycetota bacterium]
MRAWLYNLITTDPGLLAYFEDLLKPGELFSNRIYQGETLSDRLTPKPYMFYTLGQDSDEFLSETVTPHRQFFTIYVHDLPSDYSRIDDIIDLLKLALVNKSSKEARVMTIRHLETSADFDDNTLGTILRYVRFQAIRER